MRQRKEKGLQSTTLKDLRRSKTKRHNVPDSRRALHMHALERDAASAQLACNMTVQHVQVCWEMQWPRPSHDSWPRMQHITKNAPYAWGNFHACAITIFQKPQQLGRARIACSSIATSRAQRVEPDLSSQRCCKLRLKLLLVDQLAKKTWKLIVEFVTTKRLVCKNGHSLVEPASRVFYTVSVSACLFVGEQFFQKVRGCPLPSTSPFTLFAR